jgi:hypothetical protein
MAGFQILDDHEDYEITIQVRYGAGRGTPTLEQLQTALTYAYAQAFAEATERLKDAGPRCICPKDLIGHQSMCPADPLNQGPGALFGPS